MPEDTLLYRIVAEHLETFLAEAREKHERGLPSYVEKELREYTVVVESWAAGGTCFASNTAFGKRIPNFWKFASTDPVRSGRVLEVKRHPSGSALERTCDFRG